MWINSWRPPGGETFRHCAGRNNTAGQFYLVCIQATVPYSMWHISTAAAGVTFTRIRDPPTGTLYKGLSLAPFNPAVRQPSRTAQPSTSPTASITPSNTPSTSLTSSVTPSLSLTASTSLTASPGSSPSTTGTPTVTPTGKERSSWKHTCWQNILCRELA